MTYSNSIALACLIFMAFGCQSQDESLSPDFPSSNLAPYPTQKDDMSYLALGDSYTIGESVEEWERYPIQLSNKLRELGIDLQEPQIIARTGWTTDELATGIDDANIEGNQYGLVSLLIGVNNQYRGRSVESYRPEFSELLNQAIEFAGGDTDRVFVLSIPDYAFTQFGGGNPSISQGIDEYNAANREITELQGVRYFDITPISRQGLDQPELVASDGLHPSGEQYRLWVLELMDEVREMLEQ